MTGEVASMSSKSKDKTISEATWDQVKDSTHRAIEGKLPKGDYWMTEKMPWMTEADWNDYQERLSNVPFVPKKANEQRKKKA